MARRLRVAPGRPVIQALLSLGLTLVLVSGIAAVGSPRAVGADAMANSSVSGSPFRGSGVRARVTLTVVLAESAELTVRVLDYEGKVVRKLVDQHPREPGIYPIAWDGRDGKGRKVDDGPYRMRATVEALTGISTVEHWVTKAPAAPYPTLPGAIVVAINPGHGGSDTGASVRRTREKTINLDIARRLRRMLEAAGIKVVMTRTGDAAVNRPAIDRNGNGRVDHTDELIARNDIGNLARADLMLNVHTNATDCRCGAGTQMFINRKRPWAAESRRLALAVQAAHVRRLRAFESPSWKVVDRGVGSGDYMSLQGPTTHARRPSLMPAILGESLYLDRRLERARLNDPRVRTALAAAYFDGVTAWLETRLRSVRYADIEVPRRLPVGGTGTVRLRLTNNGNRSLSTWRLEARLVPRVPFFDGSGTPGRLVGSMALPNGLAPGADAEVELGITMPDVARSWLLKLDVVRPAGRFSHAGVVQPQLRIATEIPDPTPSVVPSVEPSVPPSGEPSVVPSVEPSVPPSVEPSVPPSVAPSVIPSVEPFVAPDGEPGSEPVRASMPAPNRLVEPEPSPSPSPEPLVGPEPEPVVGSEPAPEPLVGPEHEPSPSPEPSPGPESLVGPEHEPDPFVGSEHEPESLVGTERSPAP